jgi:hypothetical protein
MRELSSPENWKAGSIASEPIAVCKSPDARKITVGHPSIIALSSGRILVSFDYQGPGLGKLKGKKGKSNRTGHWVQGLISVSADKGKTWTEKHQYPAGCGHLFSTGANIYLPGYTNGLQIMRSGDGGEDWSKPDNISPDNLKHRCYEGGLPSVLAADDEILMLALSLPDTNVRGEIYDLLEPVLLRAKCGVNLQSGKNWTAAKPGPKFSEIIDMQNAAALGAPLFSISENSRERNIGDGRWAGHPGWSNPHLLRIQDPRHPWQNRERSVLHILSRASVHRSNCAVLTRIDADSSGNLRFTRQSTPCGTHFSLLPMPGGHLPFEVFYDDKSEKFWLISNTANNSMIAPRNLPSTHAGLPCEQRTQLQLHFSRNLVDWNFAGIIANASQDNFISIHEPAAVTLGEDLHIVARASDSNAKNERDSNNIAFMTLPNFRELIY